MKAIPLNKEKRVLVDDSDYGVTSICDWLPHKGRSTYYASRLKNIDGRRKRVYLHRELLGITDPKIKVDHRDGNGLNCQRENLRVATNSQNHQAKTTRPAHFRSRYRGVHWHKQNQKWCASIRKGSERKYLGSFNHEEYAALAYDGAARQMFGDFAQLNFPHEQFK